MHLAQMVEKESKPLVISSQNILFPIASLVHGLVYIYSLYLQVGLNSAGKNSNPKHKCHYVVTDTNTTVNTLHCYIEKQLCEQ